MRNIFKLAIIGSIVSFLISQGVFAQNLAIPQIELKVGTAKNPQEVALSLQIILLLTVLTLAPAILIMLTSFTRIIIVLAFCRQALATQQIPPTQILVGLALFLTFFTMAPVINQINTEGLQPYFKGEISFQEAIRRIESPLRDFMFRQTRKNDLALFIHISKLQRPKNPQDIPTYILIPAFIVSELTTAFTMGFILFIPFLIIDIVVSAILMSMGMMLLPPVIISFPFKILLFIMVDGWHLLVRSLVYSFY